MYRGSVYSHYFSRHIWRNNNKSCSVCSSFVFMISGYYLWNDNTEVMIQRIPEKVKRLVRLTIICVLIYAMYAFIFDRGMYNVNFIRVILIALVINDTSHLFCAWQLWYLIALIYSYIVIFYLLKWNKLSLMRVTVPILLIVRVALGFSDTYALVFHQSYLFAEFHMC